MLPIQKELPPTAGFPLGLSDLFAQGNADALETRLASLLGVNSVQVESSGTACLRIAFETLKRRSSRRVVLISAYTCPLVVRAVEASGLTLRVCDTAPDTFDFDPASLRKLCDRETLCLVPAHIGGLAADLETALSAAAGCGAAVVEDAAQSLGATWHGRPVGTVGDIGVFSLTRGKGLTIYEGGFLAAADAELASELKAVGRQLAPDDSLAEALKVSGLFGYALMYNPLGLHFAYGAPLRKSLNAGDRVAAVGDHFAPGVEMHRVGSFRKRTAAVCLDRFPAWLSENAGRGRRRAAQLAAIAGIKVLQERAQSSGSWPFLMVVMPSEESCEQALARLWRAGLGVTKLFAADIPSYRYLEDVVPRDPAPNAHDLAGRMLTVTNSLWLDDAAFEEIALVLAQSAAS